MKKQIFLFFFLIGIVTFGQAQNGISISQSENIKELMEIKKEFAKNEKPYQIQIYNGNISGATQVHNQIKNEYPNIPTTLTFETPNYKVRLGAFRTRLEAEKQLIEIKRQFPGAFIISFTSN